MAVGIDATDTTPVMGINDLDDCLKAVVIWRLRLRKLYVFQAMNRLLSYHECSGNQLRRCNCQNVAVSYMDCHWMVSIVLLLLLL